MKIDSRFAGTPLKDYHTAVSWRATTNYAAAVAEDNPLYFDDTRDDSLVAPPTFPVAVTWPILSRLPEFIDAKEFPSQVLLTQVHYSEHLVLHRLVRPKDELAITGRVAAILPHRAGTHVVMALLARDRAGGPVFTEYIGAMLRGVTCDGEKGKQDLPRIPKADPSAPPAWASMIPIDPCLPYVYDGCTNIEFPIHTSPRFARDVGLPGIILQGTATLACAVRELVIQEADANPNRVAEIACNFTHMVKPGTNIKLCCLGSRDHTRHRDIFFEVLNAENKKAIRSGYVKLKKEAS